MIIFIVEGSSGAYSDRTEWTICGFTTEARAQQLADNLNELEAFNKAFHQRQYIEFDEQYCSSSDIVAPIYPALPDLFHTLGRAFWHGKATEEEEKNFKELNNLHQKNIEAYKEACHIEDDKKAKAKRAWFFANYFPPSHLIEAMQYIKYDGEGYQTFDSRYYQYAVEVKE